MCEPTTLIAAAGLAMSAYGSYSQAQAAKSEADYMAGVERNNAIIAERNAKEIERQGEDEANRYRARVRQFQADQTVGLAGQGVDVTEGTSIDLLADTAELGELDAQIIRNNASREAYNARVQGNNHSAQAGLYDLKSSSQSPLFSAGVTLLSGAGQVADKWNASKTGN